MEWLKSHLFIAAWASPIIALIGLLLRHGPQGSGLNWTRTFFYVGFLSGFALLVTPGVDSLVHGIALAIVAMGFGTLMRNYNQPGAP
jgi:hypothetical protein